MMRNWVVNQRKKGKKKDPTVGQMLAINSDNSSSVLLPLFLCMYAFFFFQLGDELVKSSCFLFVLHPHLIR